MSESLSITFLGTGTSHGIPMIGCGCAVCRSTDPRDKRNRTSLAVRLPARTGGRVLLMDVPPELRLSAVATGLERVDAVLLTHGHADHIMGMDDMRRFNNIRRDTIDVYANGPTLDIVRKCFGYAVGPYLHPDRPSLALHEVTGRFELFGVPITPVPLLHGRLRVLGFRLGGLAYCTDCSEIPPESLPLLTGLDLLVLDALRFTPHPAHFNLEQALAVVKELRPRRALLTHIAHEVSHADVGAMLPEGVELAHDGLRVDVPPGTP